MADSNSSSTALLVAAGMAGCAVVGGLVCRNAGLLHPADKARDRHLRVVVTGSTRGLGHHLAREHVRALIYTSWRSSSGLHARPRLCLSTYSLR